MTESKDLIIITASCGKNLELSEKFLEKSNELKISSEILDLTTLDIPLFNPRIHSKENIPSQIEELKKRLFAIEKWVICAPEYNGSIPPILSNFIAWLSISGDDFRNLFNGQPIAIATFSGGIGLEPDLFTHSISAFRKSSIRETTFVLISVSYTHLTLPTKRIV